MFASANKKKMGIGTGIGVNFGINTPLVVGQVPVMTNHSGNNQARHGISAIISTFIQFKNFKNIMNKMFQYYNLIYDLRVS